ncbi:MAG TPA: CHASE domain-containing protein [Stellaceae bacterium]|nr:CHASE domain-containing protein [Stellaceae bacterium]
MRGFVSRRGWARSLAVLFGLIASYVLIGRLGLLLAVPPGYATAIFPPAGIAIGGVLILGRVALPATFFGEFALYLWINLARGHLGWPEIAVDLMIAAAATVQAAVGGRLLWRAVGYPAHLDNVRDVLRFFIVCPIACLISATLALSGVWALGMIATAELSSNWFVWWIGDTLGVIVVVPLMLALIGEPRASWRVRGPYIAVPIVLVFAVFVAIFSRISNWESNQSLLEFRVRSQHLADVAQASLAEQSAFLEQLGSAFGALHSPVSRQDFHVLVQKLLRRFSTIQAVEWAPRVADADRAAFIAAQRAQIPGFDITGHGARGMQPMAHHAFYYPVTYLEPLAGNTEAVGYDLASNPDRRAAIERAIASGEVTATAPIRLVQEHGHQTGILLIAAVPNGPNGRGVVLVVLRMGTFTEGLLAPLQSILRVRFFDAVDRQPPLFDDLTPAAAKPALAAGFPFGGRHYVVQTAPTAAYRVRHRRWESGAVLLAGLLSTGLLGALLMLGSGQARRAQLLIDERTEDLQVANRRLRDEMAERERAVSALQQARHMEAIGQLTGGVAHDFNNLLTIIIGNLELLHAHIHDAAGRRLIEMAESGAEQGAHLVSSLLAFARRQNLRPEIVDLNRLIGDFDDLMRRAAGQTVELRLVLDADRALCRIDPTQFQAALLNLVVNAREAMPHSGVLTIETQNAASAPAGPEAAAAPADGPFVRILVRDTGIGMPPEVLERVFEPFYTTREVGRGSGLGLSQVYGFVSQSGGHVRISSTPGIGTAVSLYLPVAVADCGEASVGAKKPAKVAGGDETILVVEDEAAVRDLTAERLQILGYRVRTAGDGPAALDELQSGGPIDLLFSDLVMPNGISGDELARRARVLCPGIKVLLTSGYALALPPGAGPNGFRLLQKPYRTDDLAQAVRAALDVGE